MDDKFDVPTHLKYVKWFRSYSWRQNPWFGSFPFCLKIFKFPNVKIVNRGKSGSMQGRSQVNPLNSYCQVINSLSEQPLHWPSGTWLPWGHHGPFWQTSRHWGNPAPHKWRSNRNWCRRPSAAAPYSPTPSNTCSNTRAWPRHVKGKTSPP